MKKMIFILGMILSLGFLNTADAQSISININLDKQPAWGPVGYETANYYYFPDLNIYFDVNNALFYYLSGSKWISNMFLPDKYSKYDFYSLYKVVINDSQPWLQNKTHKKQYSDYKNNKTQTPIRFSNDSKYNKSKENMNVWVNNNNFNKENKQNNKNKTSTSANKNNANSKSNNTGKSNTDKNNSSNKNKTNNQTNSRR